MIINKLSVSKNNHQHFLSCDQPLPNKNVDIHCLFYVSPSSTLSSSSTAPLPTSPTVSKFHFLPSCFSTKSTTEAPLIPTRSLLLTFSQNSQRTSCLFFKKGKNVSTSQKRVTNDKIGKFCSEKTVVCKNQARLLFLYQCTSCTTLLSNRVKMTRHKAPTRKSAFFSLHWCHILFIQLFTNSLVFLLTKQLVVPKNWSLNFLQHSNPFISPPSFHLTHSFISFFCLILLSHSSISFIPSSIH